MPREYLRLYDMVITEQTLIRDIATALPSSVRVFQRYGIDFCCGGGRPIGEACQTKGLALEEVASAIATAAEAPAPDERDWRHESLAALIEHIVATYHRPLREELPRLEAMAEKVVRVHGENAPQLTRVEEIVRELAEDLSAHMRKEEVVLFPAIHAAEAGQVSARTWIAAPISAMEHEHDQVGALLDELHRLTRGYAPPEWGCQTFRALYHGLEEFEAAMHVHVHLENNVLFPRALGQAQPLVERG